MVTITAHLLHPDKRTLLPSCKASVPSKQIAPSCAGAQAPEDAIEDLAVVVVGSPGR